MNPNIVLILVVVAFAAGVVFHKYVISEADSLKTHVTDAVNAAEIRIRADISSVLSKVSKAV